MSLFFVLAVPSLRFAFLDMDHCGFYRLVDAGTHVPYMLALRDPSVNPSQVRRRFLLYATIIPLLSARSRGWRRS